MIIKCASLYNLFINLVEPPNLMITNKHLIFNRKVSSKNATSQKRIENKFYNELLLSVNSDALKLAGNTTKYLHNTTDNSSYYHLA